MTVVKLKPVTENQMARPPRPSKAAIAYLKSDPTRAPEFDAKYGTGTAAPRLQQTAELIDTVKAPRQAIVDQDGNVVGAVPITKLRFDEETLEWECARCAKTQDACTCDNGDELLKA
jgi:hypothetical protein